jgi:hypothetical protein
MSILARYSPVGLTRELYDKVSADVEEKLGWPPDGLELHAAFGEDGDLRVTEIWSSREQMEAFDEKIIPLLSESGVEMAGEPEYFPVHKLEQY